MKNEKIGFLDGIRGLAALYVMIGHARWLLWEGFTNGYNKHPEAYTVFEKVYAYFISSFKFGYNVVLLFFVLSGFVIHYSATKAISSTNFNWNFYFIKRIKRIYPPFLFSLLLTFILDYLGSTILNLSFYKTGSLYSSFNINELNTSMLTLAGNIFFLMKSYVPIFGSNESTWSLTYEWWFYIIYPVFYLIFKNRIYLSTLIIFVISLLTFFTKLPYIQLINDVFYLLPVWWIGVILSEQYIKNKHSNFTYFLWLFPLLLYLASINYTKFNYLTNILWGLAFAGLISFLSKKKLNNIFIVCLSKLKWLGDFSYTLYIVHLPILFLFHALLLHFYGNQLPKSFLFFHLSIPLILLISFLISKLVEKPFK